jgi:hypothetical protein
MLLFHRGSSNENYIQSNTHSPGRRAVVLLAPNNATVATVSLWGTAFAASLALGGQYVSLEDDAGVSWSLMPAFVLGTGVFSSSSSSSSRVCTLALVGYMLG